MIQSNTIQTGPVPWAIWHSTREQFAGYSLGFPNSWLANRPSWLPNAADFQAPFPEGDAWFIRPVGKRVVFGLFACEGNEVKCYLFVPTQRQFLDAGSFAPGWLEGLKTLLISGELAFAKTDLNLKINPPVTSAKELGQILANQDLASLLGGAQAMVDQARVVVASPKPETGQIMNLLPFVPHTRRAELALTSWWPRDTQTWDIRVGPADSIPTDSTLWHWQGIADYPVGKYESALHEAISLGNDLAVSNLLGRASRDAMLRLGMVMIVVLVLGQLFAAAFGWRPAALKGPVNQRAPIQGEKPASFMEPSP